ncbi:hypothetical protein E4U43_008446 [Claviceps pusilla]|uniref:Uncharacterized protein n=1 Tax=Claviceps pusilla TaxID=123648 RepID=A0A9P7NBC7_9HYPO|nr:hypothetical protein E4U43_008446 [Claviceps pusilla]
MIRDYANQEQQAPVTLCRRRSGAPAASSTLGWECNGDSGRNGDSPSSCLDDSLVDGHVDDVAARDVPTASLPRPFWICIPSPADEADSDAVVTEAVVEDSFLKIDTRERRAIAHQEPISRRMQ